MLREGRAILGSLVENFANFPGLVAGETLQLAPGVDSQTITDTVQRLQPGALPIPSPMRPPKAALRSPGFLRLVRSPSELEAGVIELRNIPGVLGVSTFFPGASRAYRHWFDARIFEILARNGR
jgi:hypothetical protein